MKKISGQVPIREYCEILINNLEHRIEILLIERDRRITDSDVAAQKALEKAQEATERRLELLNEFRSQAADQARSYVQKETIDGLRESLDQKFVGLLHRIEQNTTDVAAIQIQRIAETQRQGARNTLYGLVIAGLSVLATIVTITITLYFKLH